MHGVSYIARSQAACPAIRAAQHALAADAASRRARSGLFSALVSVTMCQPFIAAAPLKRNPLAGNPRSAPENGLTLPVEPRILILSFHLWRPTMEDLLQRITVNPNMAFGKPTIRGLRYSVEWLLELLSSGMSQQEILADYEDLEPADIYAALQFASKRIWQRSLPDCLPSITSGHSPFGSLLSSQF